MKLYVEGVGLRGPGLADWMAGRRILAGQVAYRPAELVVIAGDTLPAAERRRATASVKLAIAVCSEAMIHACARPEETPSVFSSSGGDGATITAILATLATESRELSPTGFHNSVHNTPSGYWSIATHSREASTSLCAFDFSFAAGLLEAASQALTAQCPVLLAAYDLPYPPPLHAVRPIALGFAVAFVLSPQLTARSVAGLSIELTRADAPVTGMSDPVFEALRLGNPAARSLTLLIALAAAVEQRVIIEYVAGNVLTVAVVPLLEPSA